MQFRAINPDGDIDIEWTQIGVSNISAAPQVIVTQSLSATIALREFVLRWNGNNGGLQLSVGGTGLALTVPCLDGKYRIIYSGSTYTVFYNGVLSRTGSFNRGTGREPTAVTLVGCRNNAGIFTEFVLGSLFDLRINGVLYPIADRNQAIQLPSPSGLGAELITQTVLENPAVKGTQWTYLGDGRWQYIGDGSFNELMFINNGVQPEAGFLEFEVESITGPMRCYTTIAGVGTLQSNPRFTTPGRFRHFYTSKSALGGSGNFFSFFRDGTGVVSSCIIKNISFKPLWVANATELVTNGDFSNGTTGWSAFAGGSLSVTSGQAVLTTTGSGSRFERGITLEAGSHYLITGDLIGFTGNTHGRLQLIRGAAGNYANIASQELTAAGKFSLVVLAPASDAIIGILGSGASGTVTVDNISVRKLDSLCNPLTLINTNPDRWQEVQP